MKYLILIATCWMLTGAGCKKQVDELSKLPPITQTGANTFGCLVNGKVFIPKGYSGRGTPNCRGIYDFFNGRPYFKVIAERYEENSFDGEIYFSIDSCNSIGNYKIKGNKNRFVFGGKFFNNCGISGFDTSTYQSGDLIISKLDLVNGIISGTFHCKIKPNGCDTLFFTGGRFDFKL